MLSSSKLVKSFLEDIDSEFKAKEKEFRTLTPPKTVAECITLDGTAEVFFDKELAKYCSKLSEATIRLKQIFKEYFTFLY